MYQGRAHHLLPAGPVPETRRPRPDLWAESFDRAQAMEVVAVGMAWFDGKRGFVWAICTATRYNAALSGRSAAW